MPHISMPKLCAAAALALLAGLPALALTAVPAHAMPSSIDDPPPQARTSDFTNAKAAIAKQDWPSAIALLKKVTAREPNNPEAFNLLGYATRKSGDPQGSLQYYQTALQLDRKHLGANEYIGEAYLQLGDLAKAEEHLKRLDELCTFGCREQAELKEAIEAYRRKPKSS